MTGLVTIKTDSVVRENCAIESGNQPTTPGSSGPIARSEGSAAIQQLQDLSNRRSSNSGVRTSGLSAPKINNSGAHLSCSVRTEDRRNSVQVIESAQTDRTGRDIGRDVEAAPNAPDYVSSLDVSPTSKAYAIAAETIAKSVASLIHLGLSRQYAERSLRSLMGHMASNQPIANAILGDPYAYAAISALAAAPAVAVSHYLGEVYIRRLLLELLGAQVVPTSVVRAFPDDASAQGRMKRQQAAGKIGKLPADLIGLASFGIANGIRGVLGGTTPLTASLTSGIGGGTMAAFHSSLNLWTTAKSDGGIIHAPTHHVGADRCRSMQDVYDAISKSFRSVGGNGPISEQLVNTLQDIFGARGIAALQGLLIANLVKAKIEESESGGNPAGFQKFGQATAATIALLGLGFFANLSLANRRGKTSEIMSGSITALKSMDPHRSAQDGGMHALMEVRDTGVGARAWNSALKAIDVAAHTGKTLQTLPGHVVLDGLTLAIRGAKWMTKIVRGVSGTHRSEDTRLNAMEENETNSQERSRNSA